MKAAFVVFALCFVAINAAVEPIGQIDQVHQVMLEANSIAAATLQVIEQQLEAIVLEPLHQVEEAVAGIEARREESEECVIAQEERVGEIVDTMHSDMAGCGIVAAQTSAEIATDVAAATQQLVFGGYSVLRTYQRCQKYSNSVLRKSCMARLTVQATLYLNSARRSIKTIRQSKERLPAVFVDAETCTNNSAEAAVMQLENVHQTIDSCVSFKL